MTTTPSAVDAPTEAPILVTSGPTTSVSVVAETTMKFQLFDGIDPRPPTLEETQSLLEQTSRFYTDFLKDEYSNFDTFVATFVFGPTCCICWLHT